MSPRDSFATPVKFRLVHLMQKRLPLRFDLHQDMPIKSVTGIGVTK